jgi:sugar fermentation stimulation protein A
MLPLELLSPRPGVAVDFARPLQPAILVRRERRFLMHARLPDGSVELAHCANTGRMLGVSEPGSRLWLSRAENPSRKLAWTAELIEAGDPPVLVGIHTQRANAIVREGLESGQIAELAGAARLRPEVRAVAGTRFDFLLESGAEGDPAGRHWLEVKSVTLVQAGRGLFPDAVSERGRKHLLALAERVAAGEAATLLFLVQREDAASVGPADAIDPAYGAALRRAAERGVRILAYGTKPSPTGISLATPLPIDLS